MGILRLFLALAVVAGHTASTIFGIPMPSAFDAVNYFFIISGFYMAMVLSTRYELVPNKLFYTSRILRIFPMYIFGLILMIIVNFENIKKFFPTLSMASKGFFIFSNIFILGQDLAYSFCFKTQFSTCASPVEMTINPPSWSLSIELCFYILAPFLVRHLKILLCYLSVGLLYSISLNYVTIPNNNGFFNFTDLTILNHYFFPSSFLFFGIGILIFKAEKELKDINSKFLILFVLLLTQTNTNMFFWLPIFFGFALPTIFKVTKDSKTDRLIGELSYPVYILHFPIMVLLSKHENVLTSTYFHWATLGDFVSIFTILISLFFMRFIENPVKTYRAALIQRIEKN